MLWVLRGSVRLLSNQFSKGIVFFRTQGQHVDNDLLTVQRCYDRGLCPSLPNYASLWTQSRAAHAAEVGPAVPSPLLRVPTPPQKGPEKGKVEEMVGRAVLCGIKQSPKKINLVAAMVRGMRVEDALLQLAVSPKRAAETVAKTVNAARANGVNNHGLKAENLVVAEAFVGKGIFLKRIWPHGRGKSGVRKRARCHLTAIVKEMSTDQARQRSQTLAIKDRIFRRPTKLVPHTLHITGPFVRHRVKGSAAAKAPDAAPVHAPPSLPQDDASSAVPVTSLPPGLRRVRSRWFRRGFEEYQRA